jgi:Trypsin-like peptidase domain
MAKYFLFIILFPFCVKSQTNAPNIKKITGFIYIKDSSGKFIKPIGSCFFIKFSRSNKPQEQENYIVTAKHVLLNDSNNKFYDTFYLRVNSKNGYSQIRTVALIPKEKNKNIFTHKDSTVDIAVVKYLTTQDDDIDFLDQSHILSKEDYFLTAVSEGAETVFAGLFVNHPGKLQIQPIMRFGKIALIPNERIYTANGLSEVILIESDSYGGNSGSPVYYTNTGFGGQMGMFMLGGIMSGAFNDHLLWRKKGKIVGLSEYEYNNGISYITPAYLLFDILYTDALIK